MKAYTDLPQSKKLAKILPLESADMLFQLREDKYADSIRVPLTKKHWEQMMPDIIPCWSLSSLLNVIPKHIDRFNVLRIDIGEEDFSIWYDEIGSGVNNDLPDVTKESAVDACYEMIVKLKKKNLL